MRQFNPGRLSVMVAFALAGAIGACHPPSTIETAQSFRGAWFAQEYTCGGCHAIERGAVSPVPDAPTFEAIVNRPGVTADTLVASFPRAHTQTDPDQKPLWMSQGLQDELVAYMLSLQDSKYRSPS